MSEVEKMYRNAEIKPDCTYLFLVDGNGENEAARTIGIGSKADLKRLIVDCGVKGRVMKSTNTLKPFYPLFTAEKQIEILKLLTNRCDLTISHFTEWEFIHFDGREPTQVTGKDFTETFAKLINAYWQDLAEEEKQQVKGILEDNQ